MGLFSDHRLLFFEYVMRTKSAKCVNFRLADWGGLREALSCLDLAPTETANTDIDTDWERWKDLLLSAANDFIPRETFKRRHTPPWIDGEVKQVLKKKGSCRRKAKRKSCPELWEKYKELRRLSKSLICAKRTQYFQSLPNLLKTNSKKFWSVFKSASKQSSVPNKMTWTQDNEVLH